MQQTQTTTLRSSRAITKAESVVRDARAMWSIAARIVDRCADTAKGAAPAARSQAYNAAPITAADLGFVIRMIQEADGYVDSIAKGGVLGDRTPAISEDQSIEDQSMEDFSRDQSAAPGAGEQGQGVLFKLMTQLVEGQNKE